MSDISTCDLLIAITASGAEVAFLEGVGVS